MKCVKDVPKTTLAFVVSKDLCKTHSGVGVILEEMP